MRLSHLGLKNHRKPVLQSGDVEFESCCRLTEETKEVES